MKMKEPLFKCLECGTLYYEYLEICEKCGDEVMEYNEACRHQHKYDWIGGGDEILKENYKELFVDDDIELYNYDGELILKKGDNLFQLEFQDPNKKHKLNSFGSLY